jgi:hypothetical protein
MMQEQRERVSRLCAAQIGRGEQPEGDGRFREAVSFILGPEAIEPGEQVAVLCRVTTRGQKTNGSLDRQQEMVCQAVRERGGEVGVVFKLAGWRGHSEEWLRYLEDSAFVAVAARGLGKVVVSELSRLARAPEYAEGNLRARPRPEQLERLRGMAEEYGLTIICLSPPDADLPQERSYQTRRSGSCGRPPGTRNRRPGWCKERRALAEKVAQEAVEAGKSYREAADIANDALREEWCFVRPISHETVRQWDLRRKGLGRGGAQVGTS